MSEVDSLVENGMDSGKRSDQSWRDALDLRLVRRLLRPAAQHGRIGARLNRVTFARTQRLIARVPLLDALLQRWGRVGLFRAEHIPLVHARWTPREDEAGEVVVPSPGRGAGNPASQKPPVSVERRSSLESLSGEVAASASVGATSGVAASASVGATSGERPRSAPSRELTRRLLRPLAQTGLIGNRLGRSVLARADRMTGGLPLLAGPLRHSPRRADGSSSSREVPLTVLARRRDDSMAEPIRHVPRRADGSSSSREVPLTVLARRRDDSMAEPIRHIPRRADGSSSSGEVPVTVLARRRDDLAGGPGIGGERPPEKIPARDPPTLQAARRRVDSGAEGPLAASHDISRSAATSSQSSADAAAEPPASVERREPPAVVKARRDDGSPGRLDALPVLARPPGDAPRETPPATSAPPADTVARRLVTARRRPENRADATPPALLPPALLPPALLPPTQLPTAQLPPAQLLSAQLLSESQSTPPQPRRDGLNGDFLQLAENTQTTLVSQPAGQGSAQPPTDIVWRQRQDTALSTARPEPFGGAGMPLHLAAPIGGALVQRAPPMRNSPPVPTESVISESSDVLMEGESATTEEPSLSEAEESSSQERELDFEDIAERVYRILYRKFEVERERRGLGRWS